LSLAQADGVRRESAAKEAADSRPYTRLLNLKSAVCVVPSLSVTLSVRHWPAHELSVFQT